MPTVIASMPLPLQPIRRYLSRKITFFANSPQIVMRVVSGNPITQARAHEFLS
jgi:hypothetical protein